MKKLLHFLPIALLILFSFNLNTYGQTSSIFDLAPTYVPSDTIPPVGFPLTQKWVFDYSVIPGGVSGGTVGAIFFEGKFYFNRWNGENCYTFLPGPTGAPDPSTLDTILMPPYLGNIRDMTIAPDMTNPESGVDFLYGGAANNTLNKMDAGMNVIQSWTIPGADFRAIAWDPVTGGFWSGDFGGAVTCYATDGTLVGTSANASALTGKYGMAFTSSSVYPGPNSLWVWNQLGNELNDLVQIDVSNDNIIATYSFTGPPPQGAAGGAETAVIGLDNVLLLNFQNLALGCYVLSIIPVELSSFTATANERDVVLNWSTATETNNQGFQVQRNSGSEFVSVGFIDGYGTTTETQNYSFVDRNLNAGTYTYRLKQIDFNGTSEYSEIVEVEIIAPDVYALAQNYPNPFNPSTHINFSLAADSKVTLTVFDILGQKVATLINGSLTAGSHEINFNASNLNSGIYFYRIDAAGVEGTNFSSVKKMTLTK